MTFSITAQCPDTGAFGVAICSSSIAVASRCAWPCVAGVVTSQNLTNPALGTGGQRLLLSGLGARSVLETILRGDPAPNWRQVAVIDRYGIVASHCGDMAFTESNMSVGAGVIAMGNLLESAGVTDAMMSSYTGDRAQPFAERLMRALEAGASAGGERVPLRSAGIKVCRYHDWPAIDLRVDWTDNPTRALRDIWDVYRPQEAAFAEWAADPDAAAAKIVID